MAAVSAQVVCLAQQGALETFHSLDLIKVKECRLNLFACLDIAA